MSNLFGGINVFFFNTFFCLAILYTYIHFRPMMITENDRNYIKKIKDLISDFQYLDANDEILNSVITYEEVSRCIDRLNNGKASGLDRILNEYIKSTKATFIATYVKLFNMIFDSGCFPEQWSTGMISPIYKSKGDRSNPQNYRPITILSCLGKLFTSILNGRLNDYLEDSILENQAGFRKKNILP